MASWILSIPTDKNQQVTDSVRNLIMGHVWIFQPDNNPNTNLKNSTKMGRWAQNQASAMAIPVLWPEPCRKWVRWTEEKKHRHGAVNLKGLDSHWSQTQFLEGHSSAEFSSDQLQITPAWKFLVILKTLISWIRCVWLGLELNSAELWPSRNWVWDQWEILDEGMVSDLLSGVL